MNVLIQIAAYLFHKDIDMHIHMDNIDHVDFAYYYSAKILACIFIYG